MRMHGMEDAEGDEATVVDGLDSMWEPEGELELADMPFPSGRAPRVNLGSTPPPVFTESHPWSEVPRSSAEETAPTIELERPRRYDYGVARNYTLEGPAPIPIPTPARPVLPPQGASTYASLERLAALPSVPRVPTHYFGWWTLVLVGVISAVAGAVLMLWRLS
jgi:hypothetical protein